MEQIIPQRQQVTVAGLMNVLLCSKSAHKKASAFLSLSFFNNKLITDQAGDTGRKRKTDVEIHTGKSAPFQVSAFTPLLISDQQRAAS